VERFLREINFDKTKDRFICAGDLVDRGPENERCLELLYEPWFHMTKGNHEDLMERFFDQDWVGLTYWGRNGGHWGLGYLKEQSDIAMQVRDVVAEKVKQLPLLMTVEKKNGGVFHVLHAEVWDTEPLTDEDFADEEKFRYLATRPTSNGETVMWGRVMFVRLYMKALDDHLIKKFKRGVKLEKLNLIFNPKLSHIYSGHTPLRRPVQFYGQTNLDTMAYGSYSYQTPHGEEEPDPWCGLTVTEPATGKFWFVNDREFKEVEPVVIDDSIEEQTSLADYPEAD
jgi:hypothetical protein